MTELATPSTLAALFKGLRVSDVRDGMNWAGLHNKGRSHPTSHRCFRERRCVGPVAGPDPCPDRGGTCS
jgi:hypothetical protein